MSNEATLHYVALHSPPNQLTPQLEQIADVSALLSDRAPAVAHDHREWFRVVERELEFRKRCAEMGLR